MATDDQGNPSGGGGGRLPLLAPADLNEAQKAVHAKLAGALRWAARSGFAAQTEKGELLGPFNAFLQTPEIALAQLEYQRAEAKLTSLSPALREVVILTVGSVWKAGYELYAHRAVAKTVDISPADIERLCASEPPAAMDAQAQTAQRLTLAVTRDHQVSDALYAEALAAFGAKGIVEILHLAGMYMLVSAMLNTFQVPVPTR